MIKRNRMKKMNRNNNFMNNYNNNSNVKNVVNDSKYKVLKEGNSGEDVEELQRMLVEVVNLYPSLPILTIDGVYGMSTTNAVREFQKLNSLPQSGNADDGTLKKLRTIHVNNREKFREELLKNKINEIEIRNTKENGITYLDQSDNILKEGSTGEYVKSLQSYLNVVSNKYPTINLLRVDGIFGIKTKNAVLEFQRIFNLTQDGVVGSDTWDKLSTVTGGNPISVDE